MPVLIDTVKTVRIPSYMVEIISKWKNVSSDLSIKLGRPPFFHEIAQELKIPPQHLGIIKTALRASSSSSQTISIENMWTLSEILEDKNAKRPEYAYEDVSIAPVTAGAAPMRIARSFLATTRMAPSSTFFLPSFHCSATRSA